MQTGVDTTAIFQRLVIDRASFPFKQFIKKGRISAEHYKMQVKRYPKFYASIRNKSLQLATAETRIRDVVGQFKKAYPGFVEADICIGIGNFYTGGTIDINGSTRLVYIGLEYHGLDSTAVTSEFSNTYKDYLSRSNFYRTIIHELVHVQQETHGRDVIKSYYGNKLAHAVLREGVADFIAKLIYPHGNDGTYVSYGVANEDTLKGKLKKEIWTTERSYWIYNSKPTTDMPQDVGYFMGSRIANAYYQVNKNKPGIIKEIIEIDDAAAFIEKSKYFK